MRDHRHVQPCLKQLTSLTPGQEVAEGWPGARASSLPCLHALLPRSRRAALIPQHEREIEGGPSTPS